MSQNGQDASGRTHVESGSTPEPPAMGERRARWGYGYQDKVATGELLDLLRADIRSGTSHFQGVRLADLQAGRVDDFVLVTDTMVRGNSIKWSAGTPPILWGDLIGSAGLLRELAEGWKRLWQRWQDRDVIVQLQTNRPASIKIHSASLVTTISVAEFFGRYWPIGPSDEVPAVSAVWKQIENHTGLAPSEFSLFVRSCCLRFSVPQPPTVSGDTDDERAYRKQFDSLHKAIATWITNNPSEEFVDRHYLLSAIGFDSFRSRLMQRFPAPQIPYARNSESASRIKQLLDSVSGGYVAVTGPAGVGKSTLVQDVLSEYPLFVPYFAYLPDGVGNPRDRGEALTFFQDVVTRLDKFFEGRHSLGVSDVSQGRNALRSHMLKAQELFKKEGLKTILLIDGLDHVQRELGLERSLLHELPHPDEVPVGFIIILSSQPQALLPNVIERHVAESVSTQSKRRVAVEGLSRTEVHTIVQTVRGETRSDESDALFESSSGNPLVLTYLFKYIQANPHISTADAIAAVGDYRGDIDRYYRSALSVPLLSTETRSLFALISRATPNLPIRWLQTWPERSILEELYSTVLAPFVKVEGGKLYFIHNSLVSFLRSETRSILPGADLEQDEREYHRILAERCGTAPCSDPLGRAKVFHLLRCENYRDLLNLLSPKWLREGIEAFVPHAEIHPILLHGISAAWKQKDFGEVLRLILHDFEFDQRTDRMRADELARKFLALDKSALALSQVRSAGRILVEDKYALEFSADLWTYAVEHEDSELESVSRAIYLQAKPLDLLYSSDPIYRQRKHDAPEVLGRWADVAPLFEAPESICVQIKNLRFGAPDGFWQEPEDAIKAALLYRAISRSMVEGATVRACIPLLAMLAKLRMPQLHFAALLRFCNHHPSKQVLNKLEKLYSHVAPNPDLDLLFAELLLNLGRRKRSIAICSKLKHIRADVFRNEHQFEFTDVTYTIRLRRLQELLGLGEGTVPEVADDDGEASGRIEAVARQLGSLFAGICLNNPPFDLHEALRGLLLFHNRPVKFAEFNARSNYRISQAKLGIYRRVANLAIQIGHPGTKALKDVFVDLINGPAGSQFSPTHRRFFAKVFFDNGALDREAASKVALSDTSDVKDDNPAVREEACFDIAIFLKGIGDETSAEEWLIRANTVSAGAGDHKDYHMALLADWLVLSCGKSLDDRKVAILEKFVRSLEVAGGDGGSRATAKVLTYLVSADPFRASKLAIQLIDRDMLHIETCLAALVEGAARAGASVSLLVAIFSELLTWVSTGPTSDTAVSIIRCVQQNERAALAQVLMTAVRTNSLPGGRISVARALQDVLLEEGLTTGELTSGLTSGHDDSSMKSHLYKLQNGEVLTVRQVSIRLSDFDKQADWNPNPADNDQFGWWDAIRGTTIESVAHMEKLLEVFSPPDYREVDVLAWKSSFFLKMGDRITAKHFADEAVKSAQKSSWFTRFDGAQRRVAYSAMMPFDITTTTEAARNAFGSDLSAGKLWNQSLLDEAPEILDFLQIEWPSGAVLSAIDDYLDIVLAANRQVPFVESLGPISRPESVDMGLCRFVTYLLCFPVVDIGVAARRSLARYARENRAAITAILSAAEDCDSVQLEHLIACIDTALRSGNICNLALCEDIQKLNEHESAGVRGIARRICETQQWQWQEVKNQPSNSQVLLPVAPNSAEEARIIGSDRLGTLEQLFPRIIKMLERAGNDSKELRSELLRNLWDVEKGYRWIDDRRLAVWRSAVRARFWLSSLAIAGREAAMRLLGNRALSGRAPEGVERQYDWLYPIYDPDLELCFPIERPVQFRAMDWTFSDGNQQAWLNGDQADQWTSYPVIVADLQLIGERTLFIRPDWEWPREERYRGLAVDSSDSFADRDQLASSRELTYQSYLGGAGQDDDQLLVWNSERQLVGPAYRWIAVNSNFARSLDWVPTEGRPFEWQDSSGRMMVKSIMWRDGWVGLEPPHMESLGEGWAVLATSAAINQILHERPDSTLHLWVERHAHGKTPCDKLWHLTHRLAAF